MEQPRFDQGDELVRELVNDVYREGTSDGLANQSASDVTRFPAVGYDEMFDDDAKHPT